MKPQDNENKQAVDNEPCRANKAWLLNNSKHEHVVCEWGLEGPLLSQKRHKLLRVGAFVQRLDTEAY